MSAGLGIDFNPPPPNPALARLQAGNISVQKRRVDGLSNGQPFPEALASHPLRHTQSQPALRRVGMVVPHSNEMRRLESMGDLLQKRRVRIASGQPEIIQASGNMNERYEGEGGSEEDEGSYDPEYSSEPENELGGYEDEDDVDTEMIQHANSTPPTLHIPVRSPARAVDDLEPHLEMHPFPHYQYNHMRHSKSMDMLRMTPPMPPPQLTPIEPTSAPMKPSSSASTLGPDEDRLPAFLRQRLLSGQNLSRSKSSEGRGLSRPQSMMELSRLHALQSIEDRSTVPPLIHSHHYNTVGMSESHALHRPSQSNPVASPSGRSTTSIGSGSAAAASQDYRPRSVVAMRSMASMRGLEAAEIGGSMVQLDALHTGFEEGLQIEPNAIREAATPTVVDEAVGDTPMTGSSEGRPNLTDASSVVSAGSINGGATDLHRQSTLLTVGANPVRRSRELNRILAPSSGRIFPSGAGNNSSADPISAKSSTNKKGSANVVLEQVKGKTRVELDVVLESSLVVEGGVLKGRMEVKVKKEKEAEKEVWIGRPKVRVVGFEELASNDARHIFYHHAKVIDQILDRHGSQTPLPCFDSTADPEGFHRGKVGSHTFPFSMQLQLGKGAKGGFKCKQGVVRYIVIGSVKLKSAIGTDRSIAHFYRHVEVFPYLSPAVVLASALKPLHATVSKGLFMGGSGKVTLEASMHRPTWVAGQRCYVDVEVRNETSKKIKTLTLSLIRTTTVFRPRPHLTMSNGIDPDNPDIDQDACQTQTTRKKIAETSLEMGKRGARGVVTAKGLWMGVDTGENVEFSHFLLVPADALTMARGRHLEVTYVMRVSVGGSLSADVSLDIPIRIINFVSIDPPPGHSGPESVPQSMSTGSKQLSRCWSIDELRPLPSHQQSTYYGGGMDRMQSMQSSDSMNLSDLNRACGVRPGTSPYGSSGSYDDLANSTPGSDCSQTSAAMSREFSVPIQPYAQNARPDLDIIARAREKQKQLHHQMSLDCITSVIASATSRRVGHERTGSSLKTEVGDEFGDDDVYGLDMEGKGGSMNPPSLDGDGQMQLDILPMGVSVQLDDLDDLSDDSGSLVAQHSDCLDLEDESEDEVEMVIGTTSFNEDEDGSLRNRLVTPSSASSSPARPRTPTSPARSVTPTVRSAPASPANKALPPPRLRGNAKKSQFSYATPASPVKLSVAPKIGTNKTGGSQPTSTESKETKIQRAEGTSRSPIKRKPPPRMAETTAATTAPSPELTSDNYSSPDCHDDSSSVGTSPATESAKTPPMEDDLALEPEIVEAEVRRSMSSMHILSESIIEHESKPVDTPVKPVPSPIHTSVSPGRLDNDLTPTKSRKPPTPLSSGSSVRSRILALESKNQAMNVPSRPSTPTKRDLPAAMLARQGSVCSDSSDGTSFAVQLARSQSVMSFKAPLLRK